MIRRMYTCIYISATTIVLQEYQKISEGITYKDKEIQTRGESGSITKHQPPPSTSDVSYLLLEDGREFFISCCWLHRSDLPLCLLLYGRLVLILFKRNDSISQRNRPSIRLVSLLSSQAGSVHRVKYILKKKMDRMLIP